MLVYQKTMVDRYDCLKSFSRLKTLEKRFENFHFNITYNSTQKYVGFVGFKKAYSTAKTFL